MNTLMIHEVNDWMLDLDLSSFDVLTFDDGLYSQYKNIDHFKKFNKRMYFFICTGSVCPEETFQNKEVISCDKAHELFFDYSDRTNYMKWSQIKEIYNTENCFIGGHSHYHPYLNNNKLIDQSSIVKSDVEMMMNEFKQQDIKINSFCYPYNFESYAWSAWLAEHKVFTFFGKERTPIEDLR
jgi:peptidoglycan/xylan/chitin deacetylase (PgdA/CDA1 family)